MREAKLGEKVQTMMKRVKQHLTNIKGKKIEIGSEIGKDKEERDLIEKELQKLDTKRVQLMVAAEKNSGKARMMGMFWFSIHLRKAAEAL